MQQRQDDVTEGSRRGKWAVVAAGALIVASALVIFVAAPATIGPSQTAESRDESQQLRQAAANFLRLDPDQLEPVAEVRQETGRREWRWLSPDGDEVIDIWVTTEEPPNFSFSWEGRPVAGEPRVSRQEALKVARNWAERFPTFDPEVSPSYLLRDHGDRLATHQFEWSGERAGGGRYSIEVEVDVVTGASAYCSALYWPPEPEPTMPINITRKKAHEIGRKVVEDIDGLTIKQFEVSKPRADSPYRPGGEPVYILTVEGTIFKPGFHEECGYASMNWDMSRREKWRGGGEEIDEGRRVGEGALNPRASLRLPWAVMLKGNDVYVNGEEQTAKGNTQRQRAKRKRRKATAFM